MTNPSVPITRLNLVVALVDSGMSEKDAFQLVDQRPDMAHEDCVVGDSFVKAWPDFIFLDILRGASSAQAEIAKQKQLLAYLLSTLKSFAEVAFNKGWEVQLRKEEIESANLEDLA